MNFTKLATLILAACDWLNVHAGAHRLHVCISCAENFVLDVSGLQTIAFGCFLYQSASTHTHIRLASHMMEDTKIHQV